MSGPGRVVVMLEARSHAVFLSNIFIMFEKVPIIIYARALAKSSYETGVMVNREQFRVLKAEEPIQNWQCSS
jgi:hypothetical protein